MPPRAAVLALQDPRRREAVAKALEAAGIVVVDGERVDVLVVDVTTPPRGTFVGADPEAWYAAVYAALTPLFGTVRDHAPSLRGSDSGRLIVIGSAFDAADQADASAAAAVHGGLVAFTKTLARDLGPDGVTVNEIVLDPDGSTSDELIGATVAYLAGHHAATVTGQLVRLGAGGSIRP